MSSPESTPYVGDLYDTLGVARDASTEDIKKAFRKLARECHPDVAGDSAEVKARFTRVREAYETLVDPVKRASYDRKAGQTYHAGPGRFGGKWRPPGGFDFEQVGDPSPGGRAGAGTQRGRRNPANDIGLEDIFGDFGNGLDFGFGGGPSARNQSAYGGGRPGSSGPVSGSVGGTVGIRAGQAPEEVKPGRDIHLRAEVPAGVAARGGTVTLRYPRLRRSEDGRQVDRYDEIHDLRVPPGTRHGDSLRVPRMGDAGAAGGPYGDLVADVTLVPGEAAGPEQRQRGERRAHEAGAAKPASAAIVDIGIVEALLGGRILVDTPAGRVHISVPPCTSSGTRLRLRGRGEGGGDHYVELRIVTPRKLDEESRGLIERFAALNPEEPSEG